MTRGLVAAARCVWEIIRWSRMRKKRKNDKKRGISEPTAATQNRWRNKRRESQNLADINRDYIQHLAGSSPPLRWGRGGSTVESDTTDFSDGWKKRGGPPMNGRGRKWQHGLKVCVSYISPSVLFVLSIFGSITCVIVRAGERKSMEKERRALSPSL